MKRSIVTQVFMEIQAKYVPICSLCLIDSYIIIDESLTSLKKLSLQCPGQYAKQNLLLIMFCLIRRYLR